MTSCRWLRSDLGQDRFGRAIRGQAGNEATADSSLLLLVAHSKFQLRGIGGNRDGFVRRNHHPPAERFDVTLEFFMANGSVCSSRHDLSATFHE